MVHSIPVPRGTRTPRSRPKSPHHLIPSLEITPPLSVFKILRVSGVQTSTESRSSPAGLICGGMERVHAPTGPIGKAQVLSCPTRGSRGKEILLREFHAWTDSEFRIGNAEFSMGSVDISIPTFRDPGIHLAPGPFLTLHFVQGV